MLLPDPRALPYVADARWLGKIRARRRPATATTKLDISDCGAKVRELIEEAVIADGIQILVKQVSLFTPEFEEKLKTPQEPDEARASEMEHAIKNEIHVGSARTRRFTPRCASGWRSSSPTERRSASTRPSSSSSSRRSGASSATSTKSPRTSA
jgi:hypothetical protein